MGVITTFYSFKGGVGRTMSLANIAVLLAKMGQKVLMVDWDLEAPGLHEYFRKYHEQNAKNNNGLLGLLNDAKNNKGIASWENYVSKIKLSEKIEIDVIWSGCEGGGNCYEHDVLGFDWEGFYAKDGGGRFIEDLRHEWKDTYDHIFIDSRTGITDYGGICTIQLPDFLTLVFTPNEQSVKGVKRYAIQAQKARQKLAYSRMPLLIFPLLSRYDGDEEKKRGDEWLVKSAKEMSLFYENWLPAYVSVLNVLENTKLPYIPYFSFGEELAVEESSLTDTRTLGFAYQRIAKIFEANFQDVPEIVGIINSDIEIITKLENKYDIKIPNVNKIKANSVGYVLRKGQVTELALYNKFLSDFSLVGELTALTMLNLNGNQLASVPDSLGNLTGLTSLDLGGNQLTSVPDSLANLTGLTSLGLHGNQLTSVPDSLGNLTGLTRLDLDYNQLTSVPDSLANLTGLTTLDLDGNQLTSVPDSLGNLTILTWLGLSGNQLTSVPDSLGNLRGLTTLGLSGNQLTSVPDSLGNLTGLISLGLSGNQLTSVPEWLISMGIEIIWQEKKYLNGINLYGNALENPPIEIVKQGNAAIQNYFEQRKGGVEKLYEAKLIVVGRGDVGKTWLLRRLVGLPVPPMEEEDQSTEGIDIHRWDVEAAGQEKFRINFWDFGGQATYRGTHQYFLTKQSLYLFVWEARADDDLGSFDYWLNVIRLLGEGSPVIVVMGKSDERKKDIDELEIKSKFGNVVSFHRVSALKNIGIAGLQEEIKREIGGLEHVGQELPKTWNDIRAELGRLDDAHISFDRYLEICEGHDLNPEQAMHLSRYFHVLGVFLHFESPPVLKAVVFLDPKWATDAAYNVLDHEAVVDHHGRFSDRDLGDIWQGYPLDRHGALLELMKKFELCFELGTSGQYIVPERLRSQRPADLKWDDDGATQFVYEYDFMPAGIIERFIARTHEIHDGERYWNQGVVLKFEGARALVESKELNRKIVVKVKGENRRGLLGIIRKDIDGIHKSLNYPAVKELVGCICADCLKREPEARERYEIKALRKRVSKKRRTVECRVSYEDVEILPMLKDFQEPVVITDEQIEKFEAIAGGLDDSDREKLYQLARDEKDAILYGEPMEGGNKIMSFLRGKVDTIGTAVSGAVMGELVLRHFKLK